MQKGIDTAQKRLLQQMATGTWQIAQSRRVFGKQTLQIGQIIAISGPRAGVLEIDAGLGNGDLYKKLRADDHALLRQLIPWIFQGDPTVYMSGRYVRLEAGWPDGLAVTDILLSDLGIGTVGTQGGRWIAGMNEHGATITLNLSNEVPHYLLGGFTGSGKTYAMRTAVAQLSQDDANQLVLIDGKHGAGLKLLENLPGVVGPVAVNGEQARRALSWAVRQMRNRYAMIANSNSQKPDFGRIIVVIDEIQEFAKNDAVLVEMVRILAAQGREARVHLIVGTQHPKADAFGDESGIKRNLTGRLALLTEDHIASQVVVGDSTPRADRLMGRGDAYAIVPGKIQRTQLAYIPDYELVSKWSAARPAMNEWPEFDPDTAGTMAEKEESVKWNYTGQELGIGLVQAYLGNGRPALQSAFDAAGLGKPGSVRADRLLSIVRDIYTQLRELNWELRYIHPNTSEV